MPALLTNLSQLQVQYHFRVRGTDRYINEGYMPDEANDEWDVDAVLTQLVEQISSGTTFEITFHEDCELVSIKGTARGTHPQVLVPITKPVGLVGTVTGQPAPRWMTFNVFQQPDNANRLIISAPQSIFQPGRMAFPGIATSMIEGETVSPAAAAQFKTFADLMQSIPDGVDPVASPFMSVVMTRKQAVAPYAPLQRANVLGTYVGVLGHQDTAR